MQAEQTLQRLSRTARLHWFYRATAAGRNSRTLLESYRDRHQGQRCVIIGNGPSLNRTPLKLLHREHTFGLNKVFLLEKRLGFRPSFLVVVNELVLEQSARELCAFPVPAFVAARGRQWLHDRPQTALLKPFATPFFSPDPLTRGIWEGHTVTYVAMQLAYYMGFQEVILIGVDHRFSTSGAANSEVISTEPDPNHFDPNYFGPGFRWQLPDLQMSERAYAMAREAFVADGRRIVDATVDGALTVFPKEDLAAALRH